MFCEKCGKELVEGAIFCDNCGTSISRFTDSNPPPVQMSVSQDSTATVYKKRSGKKALVMIGVLVLLVVVFMGVVGVFNGDEKYVEAVKSGHPVAYPDITYEEAYNSFFDSPKWKYLKTDDGLDIVQFDGECTYDGEPAHMVVQFKVNVSSGDFDIYAMELDDNPQSILDIAVIQSVIFES